MKVLIPLAGFGTRLRPHTWSRPKALLNVAGNTIIGHLLHHLRAITTAEVIFIVGYKGDLIEAWIRERFPHLDAHFVVQEEALGQAHALWQCRDHLDETDVLVAFGDGIVEADYENLATADADAVCLVQEVDDPRTFGVAITDETGYVTNFIEKPGSMADKQAIAGIHWFRSGRLLFDAVDRVIQEDRRTKGEYYLVDAYDILLEQGARVITRPVTYWFDAGKPDFMLETNQRLLGVGYGSADAIERSYAEDFTLFPPVYLHETAVLSGTVIGPYVSVGPGAQISNSIVRNSIIDANAKVKNVILEDSLIGEKAEIAGCRRRFFVGDNSSLNI